jgi:hypothetical protein
LALVVAYVIKRSFEVVPVYWLQDVPCLGSALFDCGSELEFRRLARDVGVYAAWHGSRTAPLQDQY